LTSMKTLKKHSI